MSVTKDSVIRAASDIADAEGLSGVSLKAVAEKLGIRTPSLYNHIAGLDDLLLDVAHVGMRTMNDLMAKAAIGASGEAAIKAAGAAYFGYVISHPGIYETIQWANWHANDETRALFDEYRSLVAKLVAPFGVKPKKREEAGNLLMSLFHGYSSLHVGAALANREKALREFANVLDLALTGFRA